MPEPVRAFLTGAFDRVAAFARDMLAQREETKHRHAELQMREASLVGEAERKVKALQGRQATLQASCDALASKIAAVETFDARARQTADDLAVRTRKVEKREKTAKDAEDALPARLAAEVARLVGPERGRLAALADAGAAAFKVLDRLAGRLTDREAAEVREAHATLGRVRDRAADPSVEPAPAPRRSWGGPEL